MSNIRKVLILDLETTGTDPEKNKVREIGMILYSVEHLTWEYTSSIVLQVPEYGAEEIHKIPKGIEGIDPAAAWLTFQGVAMEADHILCHNVEFDKSFVMKALNYDESSISGIGWICTCYDLQWPSQVREGDGLVSLALSHGLAVMASHRAIDDCMLIARLLTHVGQHGDLQAHLARGLRPKGKFWAVTSYQEKDLARNAGFKWNPDARQWQRTMAIEDIGKLPFDVVRLDGGNK